jgi:hypothetical protein
MCRCILLQKCTATGLRSMLGTHPAASSAAYPPRRPARRHRANTRARTFILVHDWMIYRYRNGAHCENSAAIWQNSSFLLLVTASEDTRSSPQTFHSAPCKRINIFVIITEYSRKTKVCLILTEINKLLLV